MARACDLEVEDRVTLDGDACDGPRTTTASLNNVAAIEVDHPKDIIDWGLYVLRIRIQYSSALRTG